MYNMCIYIYIYIYIYIERERERDRFPDAMRFKMSGPHQFKIVPDSRLEVTRIS